MQNLCEKGAVLVGGQCIVEVIETLDRNIGQGFLTGHEGLSCERDSLKRGLGSMQMTMALLISGI